MQTTTLVIPKVSRAVGTALTAIGAYTAPAGGAIIAGICVCNISAGAVNITVTVFDGTNDTNLVFARPTAIGDSVVIGGDVFKGILVSPWQVRVKSSVAASVDATMFVVEAS